MLSQEKTVLKVPIRLKILFFKMLLRFLVPQQDGINSPFSLKTTKYLQSIQQTMAKWLKAGKKVDWLEPSRLE